MTTATLNHTAAAAPAKPKLRAPSRWGDRLFRGLTVTMAAMLLLLVILVGWELWTGSAAARARFGWSFLGSAEWDPVQESFGAWPFIFGTVVSSLIALLIAVPLSIGTALFLTELAPRWLRQPLTSLIEMLAAIPSVILGLWGVFVMVPFLKEGPFLWLKHTIGALPLAPEPASTSFFLWRWLVQVVRAVPLLFSGQVYGPSMLAGGIIIAVMILPIITSVSREILRSVPDLQREAAYALGATRWEVIRVAVLSYARPGLFGAVILGLGRALGETMAVTMVIGNRPEISQSLLEPGYTLASVLANQFSEATSDLFLSALIELGLVLFAVTIVINLLAQLLLKGMGGNSRVA